MTEYKSLQQLWDENGQKPFQAECSEGYVHDVYFVGKRLAFVRTFSEGETTERANVAIWRMLAPDKPKEKKRVAHCLAVCRSGDGSFYISQGLYREDISYSIDGFVRFLTEFPLHLECEE